MHMVALSLLSTVLYKSHNKITTISGHHMCALLRSFCCMHIDNNIYTNRVPAITVAESCVPSLLLMCVVQLYKNGLWYSSVRNFILWV